MPLAAVVTIIWAGVLVVVLALYLIKVILILNHANDQLGKITFGVRAIAHQTEPVEGLVTGINTNLVAVADALDDLVASAVAGSQAETPAA